VRHRVHDGHQVFYRVAGEPPECVDVIHILHSARATTPRSFFP
jgi:plasmid stabilization system protein ParE